MSSEPLLFGDFLRDFNYSSIALESSILDVHPRGLRLNSLENVSRSMITLPRTSREVEIGERTAAWPKF